MKNIRILLVEDSPEYLDVIVFGLRDEPDMEIIGQHNTADAALRQLKAMAAEDQPQLILLDLNLPGMSGLQAIPKFKDCAASSEIIVLTESDKQADVLSAIASGALGYLRKESSLDEIINAIRAVRDGGASIDPQMARYLLDYHSQNRQQNPSDDDSRLSPRELEILTLLSEGQLQKQIAAQLDISPKTVDFHIGHVYKKLNAQNAPSAVAEGFKRGILPQD